MNVSRRQLLAGAAGCALAPLVSSCTSNGHGDVSGPLIVDTHQHLWDLSKFNLPWLATAPPVYRHNYRPEEYAAATKGLDILAVYMEVDVEPSQRPAEAQYVIDLARSQSTPTRAAVIGGRPDSSHFSDYIQKFYASGFVRGVRQVLHSPSLPAGTCLQEPFVKGVRELGKIGMSYDLCMRPTELSDGLKLAELAPDTRFVLDHCGNADVGAFFPNTATEKPLHEVDAWKRDIALLARRQNVICKISGIVARAPEKWTPDHLAPIVNHCLDCFGPNRVVFGGDWPVCLVRATYGQWVGALKEIISDRPDADQRKLWSENARSFYAV